MRLTFVVVTAVALVSIIGQMDLITQKEALEVQNKKLEKLVETHEYCLENYRSDFRSDPVYGSYPAEFLCDMDPEHQECYCYDLDSVEHPDKWKQ